MVKMKKVKELKSTLFFGRRARVDQRAIRGKMEFFSELDWVQLFRPTIDLLGAAAIEIRNPPNLSEIATKDELPSDQYE